MFAGVFSTEGYTQQEEETGSKERNREGITLVGKMKKGMEQENEGREEGVEREMGKEKKTRAKKGVITPCAYVCI